MTRVTVLVCPGLHPASGRPRRAPGDARAVELALRLPEAELELVHAGDPEEEALRDYLAMGPASLTVLYSPPEADVVPTLAEHLRATRPDLVLTGERAEGREDSGLVPYLLGELLDCPVVRGIADLEVSEARASLVQALPRGRRRALAAPLPLIAAVGPAAPRPRPCAYARRVRGEVRVVSSRFVMDEAAQSWDARPAKVIPKRLRGIDAGSAADRLRALSNEEAAGGRRLRGLDPARAARAVYDDLLAHGVIGKR